MKKSELFHLWKRQVFLRNRHVAFDSLISRHGHGSGIYLIGCNRNIVYVGQSWSLGRRCIESLGYVYHQIPDTSLPWSIALAPCPSEEMDERESAAIRSYAPQFNTSIPSVMKSSGSMPDVAGVAAVFQDQDEPCGAFEPDNLESLILAAHANEQPPWKRKKTRRKTVGARPYSTRHAINPVEWTDEESDELVRAYGMSADEPLPFKINLCDDGSVVTREGEYIGTWKMDENEHPSFYPADASESLFFDVFIGSLCTKIKEWHESNTGELIS